jgi:hypothetical protein
MRALRRRIIGRQGQVSCLRVAEVVCTAFHSTSYPIPVVSSFCKFVHRRDTNLVKIKSGKQKELSE